jgi:hypothetical protein
MHCSYGKHQISWNWGLIREVRTGRINARNASFCRVYLLSSRWGACYLRAAYVSVKKRIKAATRQKEEYGKEETYLATSA